MQLDTHKLSRMKDALSRIGLDYALLTDFYNVSYLTGHTQFFENGPSPFHGGASAALYTPTTVTLIAEAPEVETSAGEWSGRSAYFQGYGFDHPTPPMENYARTIFEVVEKELPMSGKVGIEAAYLPLSVYEGLQDIRPHIEWVPLLPYLMMGVRAIKSEEELKKLRVCAELCEVGQQAVRDLVQEAGKTEIEIYSQAKVVMEMHTKGRFALQNALHAGMNSQSPFPGMPTEYITQEGDFIISDMVPYLNGYWGDSCSTYVVGGAIRNEHKSMHKIALSAFEMGFEASKPGIIAGEIDAMIREYIRKNGYEYPHHTGHGVGVSNHEEPRIVIGSETILQAGMVVLIEPPVYKEGFGGIRLERMYLITESGAELMTHNSFELF